MKTKQTRALDNNKLSRIGVFRGKPLNSQGADGQFALGQNKNELTLYVKFKGAWHGVDIGKSFQELKNKIKEKNKIKNPKIAIPAEKIFSNSKLEIETTDGDQNLIEIKATGVSNKYMDIGAEDGSYSQIRLFEQGGASTDDFFKIYVSEHGETTLSTNDAGGFAGHLTLDPDGEIFLDARPGLNAYNSGIRLKSQGTEYGALTVHHSLSCLTLYEAAGASDDDYFGIEVGLAGATTLKTVDAAATAAHLTLDPDGNLIAKIGDADESGQSFHVSIDGANNRMCSIFGEVDSFSSFRIYEFGGQSTSDYFEIKVEEEALTTISTLDAAGNAADLKLDADGDITLDAATGNIYVKDNGGAYTPGSDYEIATKKYVDDNAGGGGTSRWTYSTTGYKTSNSSSTTYYGTYYPGSVNWYGSDASPTSVSYIWLPHWIAPADGTLTRIQAEVRVQTNADDGKFYVYKSTPSDGVTSRSLTLIGTSDSIGIDAVNQTFTASTAISSSNTFSQNDGLYIFWKKDSHSGSANHYFTVTISGEFS